MTYMAAIEFWADVLSPVQPPPNPLCPPLGQYHPPSGALGSAMPLPHPLLPIDFNYIDAHIAAVTARGVSANHGPAQYVGTVATMQRQPARSTPPPHMGYGHPGDCTSMCTSSDPVIRFVSQLSFSMCVYVLMRHFIGQDNGCTTVSGQRTNTFGAIGTPLPPKK